MALILNIDTATEAGSVCLAKDGISLGSKINPNQKDHAAIISIFIRELLEEHQIESAQIDAVAISGGPGSYTGLRVAASTAKGLCYAWAIPLIAINTLKMMANGMRSLIVKTDGDSSLLCPLIDARRMEVFSALYDNELNALTEPAANLLEDNFLSEYRQRPLIMFGSGMQKAKRIFNENPSWEFKELTNHAKFLISLSEQAFREQQFQDLAYFAPWYLKAFHNNFTHS